MKPRFGSGSTGAMKVGTRKLLEALLEDIDDELVIQPYFAGEEYGVDAYVDFTSGRLTGLFVKRKLRMRAGETEKSIAVKDDAIDTLVEKALEATGLRGPLDIDVLKYKGNYYILEINPRFGGGYPHAYECGIDFPYMLSVNAGKKENLRLFRDYKEGVVALKYTDVLIRDE